MKRVVVSAQSNLMKRDVASGRSVEMKRVARSAREHLFTMRMSDAERARLDAVAAHYGLSAADAIRMMLKFECDCLQEETTWVRASEGL